MIGLLTNASPFRDQQFIYSEDMSGERSKHQHPGEGQGPQEGLWRVSLVSLVSLAHWSVWLTVRSADPGQKADGR